MANNSSFELECKPTNFRKTLISMTQRNILLVLNVVLPILCIFSCIVVIVSIFKTNQHRNNAIKLILHLFINALIYTMMLQSLNIFGWLVSDNNNTKSYCLLEYLKHFLADSSSYTFLFILILISVDRYTRVQYSLKHKTLATSSRINLAFFIVFLGATTIALFFSIAMSFGFYLIIEKILVSFDLFVLSLVLLYLILTIRTINETHKHSVVRNFKLKVEMKIITLSVYLIIIQLVLSTPYATLTFIHVYLAAYFDTSTLEMFLFLKYLSLIALYLFPVANAAVFIHLNKQSKNYLKTCLPKIVFRQNRKEERRKHKN